MMRRGISWLLDVLHERHCGLPYHLLCNTLDITYGWDPPKEKRFLRMFHRWWWKNRCPYCEDGWVRKSVVMGKDSFGPVRRICISCDGTGKYNVAGG